MRLTNALHTPLLLLLSLPVVACVPEASRTPTDKTTNCGSLDEDDLETVEEDVTLKTADDFESLPNRCWDLRGKLTLQGTNITSIAKLDKLVGMDALVIDSTKLTKLDVPLYVYETVEITGNDVLANLEKLEIDQNIATSISVDDNAALIDLGGLENLDAVNGDLTISRNAKLPTLSLRGLTEVGGSTRISNNAALTTVDLGKLELVHRIELLDNAALTTFGAFPARSILGDFTVRGNKLLTTLGSMSSLESIQGNLTIDNNGALSNVGLFTTAMRYLTGVLTISNNPQLTDLGQLSRLTGIGAISVTSNTKLPFCKAQEIEHCVPQHGSVSIAGNNNAVMTNCPCWCD
jgi:hypothetical protein